MRAEGAAERPKARQDDKRRRGASREHSRVHATPGLARGSGVRDDRVLRLILGLGRALGRALGGRDARRESFAFIACPEVELGNVAKRDAVEKRAAIQHPRAFRLGAIKGRLELRHVVRDDGGIEAETVSVPQHDIRLVEIAAECIEGLLEDVPRAGWGAVRPQVQEHLVARPTAISRGREKREQGEGTSLRRGTGYGR